jgi:cytochrome c-type biogenesis protein CcmH/NrfF
MDPKSVDLPKPVDLTSSSTTLLLWLGGAVALVFVGYLLWDATRDWRRQREFRKRVESSRRAAEDEE